MGTDVGPAAFDGSWLTDAYWYLPALHLPALSAINASEPRIVTVQDQTVWHITSYSNGYIYGIGASNIGFGIGLHADRRVGDAEPHGQVQFFPAGR